MSIKENGRRAEARTTVRPPLVSSPRTDAENNLAPSTVENNDEDDYEIASRAEMAVWLDDEEAVGGYDASELSMVAWMARRSAC